MLLHRVSPCAQEEAIPEEVPPQVEGMEEEEEEAVQEASEAKVRVRVRKGPSTHRVHSSVNGE